VGAAAAAEDAGVGCVGFWGRVAAAVLLCVEGAAADVV
jgi:hypothetical protein